MWSNHIVCIYGKIMMKLLTRYNLICANKKGNFPLKIKKISVSQFMKL
jgi:hypothetical protein